MRIAEFGIRNLKTILLAGLTLVFFLGNHAARAEVKVIEADSAYIMGDNDSKIDALRVATQEAKRKALELAGTYVEGLTEVKDCQFTRDEVKAYTAGILETEIVSEHMRGTTEHPEITIRARCKIDTDVLAARIGQYRGNEEMKEQFDASAKEDEALRKERDALVKQLAADKDIATAAGTRQKLDAVLAKEEANDDTHKVWTAIGAQLIEADDNGREIKQADLDRSLVVLQRAIVANPQNQRARYLLAAVYQRLGDPGTAENELRTAIRNAPSGPAPHMRLAILLRDRGRYQEALKEFHFVERLRPDYLLTVYFEGMSYKDMDRCGKAVQYLNKFLKDRRVNMHQQKKEKALRVIEECGGDRPGRQRRVRQS
jgi:tetratricopeptide (TPR) repeat protein